MTAAYRIRITGRVQGVSFRAWTQVEANTVGVTGWVSNRADGSVEAHVEGNEAAVRELIDLLREGPPAADVERVELESADLEGLNSFEVRR